MLEVLYRLHHSVYEVNVALAPPQRQLQQHDGHQAYQEVKVQGDDGVGEDEDGSMKGQLQQDEEEAGDGSLEPREVILLGCLVYYSHLYSPQHPQSTICDSQYNAQLSFQSWTKLHFGPIWVFIIKFSMSTKKEKKKGGKDKEKDKERQRMAQEEARKEQERLQAQQRINVLEKSGILDAYEYFLRAICKNGLPEANIFEFAAQQILKYQKKMKGKDTKREQLGNNRSIEKEKEREVSQEKGKRLQKSNDKLEKSADKIKPPKGEEPPKQKK